MSIQQHLEQRIAELEMKVTFQVVNKMKDRQPSNSASQAEETPPPHY